MNGITKISFSPKFRFFPIPLTYQLVTLKQCDINFLLTNCIILTNSQRKFMKIISISRLMPISVCTDKHVFSYMYVRMDRWMDASIYVPNIVCIKKYMCLEVF